MTYRLGALAVCACAMALLGTPAAADTTITGTIVDTHWTPLGSPYLIDEIVHLPEGETLLIDPGVIVEFGDVGEIASDGSIEIRGTADLPVVLSHDGAEPGGMGITQSASAGDVLIEHAIFDGLARALTHRANGESLLSTTVNITNTVVRRTTHAFNLVTGTIVFDALHIDDAWYGIAVGRSAAVWLTNSLFTNITFTGVGVLVDDDLDEFGGGSRSSRIVNCTFDAIRSSDEEVPARAIVMSVSGPPLGPLHVDNVSISDADAAFVGDPDDVGWFDVRHSNVYATTTPVAGEVQLFAGMQYADPKYIGGGDFQLQPDSPLIDAGHEAPGVRMHDMDSVSRPRFEQFDIGAFEFASVPVCGNGIKEFGESCDDGNEDPFDSCDACAFPNCGNGVLDEGEPCDDGNDNDADACSNTCEPHVCGDGLVNQEFEKCDDGNRFEGDGCSVLCTLEGEPIDPPPTGLLTSGGCSTHGRTQFPLVAFALALVVTVIVRRRRNLTLW